MKKLLAFLLLFKLSIMEATADPIKATINCTIHGQKKEANPKWLPAGVVLYQIKNGEAVKIASQRPDENWNCTFKVDVKEGMFFISRGGGKGGIFFPHVIYLKTGEDKKVDLFYTKPVSLEFDSCVVDQPNAETKSLQAWTIAFNKYADAAKRKPAESYKKYDELVKFASSFLKTNKTTNTYFNTWLADKIDTDVKYFRAANFFRFGRLNGRYDSSAAGQSFYKPLYDKKIINDARLLRSEHGMELLNYTFGYWKLKEGSTTEQLVANLFSPENAAEISNSSVKVAFLLYKMPGIREYEDFVKYVQPYKNLFTTTEQKALYQKRYEELYLFAKGTPGYDFRLKDVNDKIYTLSSFKGKVVVIDMWAMWCAPCLAEKPVMEKIAEGYHDRNDIVFVGVSTDGLNRKEVWKNFVKKKGFTSVELLSNHTESIQKYYKIEGIPRFLVFDREGKIVTVDAPMPSNSEFKKLIDQTLQFNSEK
ncbi:MAG: TlpA family protein disulfide reductase [Chitinophagales bacterium]